MKSIQRSFQISRGVRRLRTTNRHKEVRTVNYCLAFAQFKVSGEPLPAQSLSRSRPKAELVWAMR